MNKIYGMSVLHARFRDCNDDEINCTMKQVFIGVGDWEGGRVKRAGLNGRARPGGKVGYGMIRL